MQYRDMEVEAGGDYRYRLVLEFRDGTHTITGPVSVQVGPSRHRTALFPPSSYAKSGLVRIRYAVGPVPTLARLAIHDARGREIWSIARELHAPGEYSRGWERLDRSGVRVPRGVYFVSLTAGSTHMTRKLVLTQP